MYNEELQPVTLDVKDIYLDPNNPRFFEKNKKVPYSKYSDEKVQADALKSICEFSVDDLVNSIVSNGFLPMDRIVVKKIPGTEQYFVLEGNRRLASIKTIIKNIQDGNVDYSEYEEAYFEKLSKSLGSVEVLLYNGDEDNISWMLQGIRHISGIKDWSPTQRAKLVSELIETKEYDFSSVGKKFGLSAIAVGRLYRGYKGLQQMKTDDDFSNKAQNDFFTLFEEAYKNTEVRKWMKWNDKTYEYEDLDNFKQFCSWISKDEDQENLGVKSRRLHDSRHVRMLGNLISRNRKDLIGQVDQFETTIESANGRAVETGEYDWRAELDRAEKSIKNLPVQYFTDKGTELAEKLELIKSQIESCIKLINK